MSVGLDVEVKPVVSLAMAHNRIPVVERVRLTNHGDERRGLTLHITVDDGEGPVSRPWETIVDLPEDGTVEVEAPALRMDGDAMLQLEERRPGTVTVQLRDGEIVLAQQEHEVVVLAGRQWLQQPERLGLEMLAAHVMPNSPQVAELLSEVADLLAGRTGSGSIEGYQGGAERVDAMAHAVFDAMRARGIRYANPPASWSEQGQKIRTPQEVLDDRLGTCLDISVVMAAVMEQAGIRPHLWVLEDHAFVGYWRDEQSMDTIVAEDASALINLLDLGLLAVVETTLVTSTAEHVDFALALSAPLARLADLSTVRGVVDVHAARRNNLVPLPSRSRAPAGEVQIIEYRPTVHSAPIPTLVDRPKPATAATEESNPAPPRVGQWQNALLDPSLRNRLINFTDRYAVQLDIPTGQLATAEDLISDGKMLMLRASDDVPEIYRERGVRFGRDLTADYRLDIFARSGSVFTDATGMTYASRLRRLAHNARTGIEETGANNLYLTMGSLQWSLDGRELQSPLILIPVQLSARGRGETAA